MSILYNYKRLLEDMIVIFYKFRLDDLVTILSSFWFGKFFCIYYQGDHLFELIYYTKPSINLQELLRIILK